MIKGCQKECNDSSVEVSANLTLTTECCSENLCNLFSKTDLTNSSDIRPPVSLIRLEPVNFTTKATSTKSADSNSEQTTQNTTTSANSKDRLIITAPTAQNSFALICSHYYNLNYLFSISLFITLFNKYY